MSDGKQFKKKWFGGFVGFFKYSKQKWTEGREKNKNNLKIV